MAPVFPSSNLHGATNGTNPHCDRLAAAAAAAAGASTSSASQSTSAPFGYISLGLIGVAIITMVSYWLYMYVKGDYVRKQRHPASLPTSTLPLGMADVEGRNSLGSSVRSDIGTHVNLAGCGLHSIVEEPSSSTAQTKAAPGKPVKKSVFFEELERREQRFNEPICQV